MRLLLLLSSDILYTKQRPPFAFTVLPVDHRLPSSDKNATAWATSSTSAILGAAEVSFAFVPQYAVEYDPPIRLMTLEKLTLRGLVPK